jgi:hypothetical protein
VSVVPTDVGTPNAKTTTSAAVYPIKQAVGKSVGTSNTVINP